MIGNKILLKDVYARPLGDQIIYWRINTQTLDKPVLDWTIVNKGRNIGASKFRVDNPSVIHAMKQLQQPEYMVEMDDVNAYLLEQFMEWGWLQPTLLFQRGAESYCW